MYQIFNPEIPGLEPPNTGISGLRKMPGIPGFGIPGLESLAVTDLLRPLPAGKTSGGGNVLDSCGHVG
jgi:hypothetical protein